MKLAVVTFCTLALALGVQASVLPWGNVVTEIAGSPLSFTAVSSPIVHGWPWGGSVVVGHPAVDIHDVHHDIHHDLHHPLLHGHASYVAKTRGALHAAPLEGHLNSVANINVQPAPGTI